MTTAAEQKALLAPELLEQEQEAWAKIKQGPLINDLSLVLTVKGRNTGIDQITASGEEIPFMTTTAGRVIVKHLGRSLEWTHGCQRALRYLNILHTEAGSKNDIVVINAKEYADFFKISNQHRAHVELKEALVTFMDSRINFTHKRGWRMTQILADVVYGDRRGEYFIQLSPFMHEALKMGLPMYIYIPIWQIDPKRYPHAAPLYDLFSAHQRRNLGKEAGFKPRLATETVLSNCHRLPTYKELRKKESRDFKARIITPIERNLDKLVDAGAFKTWTYRKAGGKKLTKKELERASRDYNYFITLYIEVELTEHPELVRMRDNILAEKNQESEDETSEK